AARMRDARFISAPPTTRLLRRSCWPSAGGSIGAVLYSILRSPMLPDASCFTKGGMSENDVGCARVGCRSVLIAAMAGALMQSTGAHARNLASWQAEISALALGGA